MVLLLIEGLLPNRGGAQQQRRRLLVRVAYSSLLHGAELWSGVATYCKYRGKLESLHRRCCLRTTSAYRTVSLAAAEMLTEHMPIVLVLLQRKRISELGKFAACRQEMSN